MAVRPSAILDSIITEVEGTTPFDTHEATRRKGPHDTFKYTEGTQDRLNRDRGFTLEVELAPATLHDLALCKLRKMALLLVVSYALTSTVWHRVADDADALEEVLLDLVSTVSAVDVSEVSEEMPIELDTDNERLRLFIPFKITYSRG